MALEEDMAMEQEPQVMTPEQEEDLSIVVNLAKDLIDDGGYEIIEQALDTKDPGQIIGQFMMQMVAQMTEQFPDGVEIDPAVYLAEGGWVEQVSDYLQEEYDVPREVMDRAEIFIGTASQQMLEGQQASQAGGMPPQTATAPVLPQGGM